MCRFLLLEMLQQRGGCQDWMVFQQGQPQRLPHRLGGGSGRRQPRGDAALGLEIATLYPAATAHRETCRSGSPQLVTPCSTFAHVERNLLPGEKGLASPGPCARHQVLQFPSVAVKRDARDRSTLCSSNSTLRWPGFMAIQNSAALLWKSFRFT